MMRKTVVVITAALGVACSSSRDREAASEGTDAGTMEEAPTCDGADECVPWRCECADGTVQMSGTVCAAGRCADGAGSCEVLCREAGGLTSYEAWPHVIGSPECDAWCARGDALACPMDVGCNPAFFCLVEEGSCAAAKRAALQCTVDEGEWACGAAGSRSSSSTCPSFDELCDG
jgi:hypothetical protein